MAHFTIQSMGCLAAAGSLAFLMTGSALGDPPAGEDFNTGNAENWQPEDPLKDTFGPTSFGIDDGAYRITSQPLPPIPAFVGAGAVFSPSAVSPEEYSNGIVRGSVRFHNEHTNASIYLRTNETATAGYAFFLNNFQDFIGIADLATPVGNIDGIGFPLDVGVDYMVEGRALGDELSIKIWVHGEPEPAEPQVTVTDSNHTVGVSALIVYNQSSNSGGTGGVLDASFDDFSFTPQGTTLIDDFVDGADGWSTNDNMSDVGGAVNDVIDAEYYLGSAKSLSADELYWTAAGLIDSYENPGFTNGVYQTKFRLRTSISSAGLVVRDSGDGDAGSYYLFVVEPTVQDGRIGIVRAIDGQNVWQELVPFNALHGQDYYLEAAAIGDEFAMKVWDVTDEKPDAPQVTATDSNWDPAYTGFAVLSYKRAGDAGSFSTAFSSAWFTPECATADLNCDGVVNVLDLLILLEEWGDCPKAGPCPADLNGDGSVNVLDLLILLENWG